MNLVQTKQVQGLEGRLTTLETGTLKKGALVGVTGDIYQIASGNFSFTGNKNFYGNVTIDSPQGLGVQGGSLYVYGYGFIASGLNVGNDIADPRINSTIPRGMLNVTGGSVYVENGGIYVEHGDLSVSGNASVTGYVSGSDDAYFQRAFVTGTNGEFFQLNKIQCSDLTKACNLVYTTGVQYIEDLNVSGSLNVSGNVSGSGDAYFKDIYVTGANGDWIKLGTGHGSAAAFTCQDLTGCNVVYSTGTQYVQDLHVSGSLSVKNSLSVTGNVSGSGEAYFKDIYVTGANGDWIKLGTGHGSAAAFACEDLSGCNVVYSTGTQYVQDLHVSGSLNVTGSVSGSGDAYFKDIYVTGANGDWIKLGTGHGSAAAFTCQDLTGCNVVYSTGTQYVQDLHVSGSLSVKNSLSVTGNVSGSGEAYFKDIYVTGANGDWIKLGTGHGSAVAFVCEDLSGCNVVYSTGTQYVQDLHVSGSLNVTGSVSGSGDAYFKDIYVTGANGDWIKLGTGHGSAAAFTCQDLTGCNVVYSTGTQYVQDLHVSGSLSVKNSLSVTGNVSGSGEAYFKDIYVTGANGDWIKLGTGHGSAAAFACEDLSGCNVVYSTGTQYVQDLHVSGSLNVTGSVSGSGDAYFKDIYVTGANGDWIKLGTGHGSAAAFTCQDLTGCNVVYSTGTQYVQDLHVSGSLSVKDSLSVTGNVSGSGEAYFKDIYVTGANGDWIKLGTGHGSAAAFSCKDLGDCNLVYSTGTQYIQELYVTGATFSGKDFYTDRAYVTGSDGGWIQLGTGGGGSASSDAVLKRGIQYMQGPLHITSGDGKAPSASLIATGGPGMCDDWFGGDGYFLRLYVTGADGAFMQVGTGAGGSGGGGSGSAFKCSDLKNCNVAYTTGTQVFSGNVIFSGNTTFKGNVSASGSGFFAGNVYISGNSGASLYVGSGLDVFCVDEEGRVGIGSGACENPLGLLNVSGDAYIKRLWVTGAEGDWGQVTTGGGGGSAGGGTASGVTEAYVWFGR